MPVKARKPFAPRTGSAVALMLSCGGGRSEPETAPSGGPSPEQAAAANVPTAKGLCQARCDRRRACDDIDPNCMQKCIDNAPSTVGVRPALLWRMLGCLDALVWGVVD